MVVEQSCRLWFGQLWVGYARGALLEGNIYVYLAKPSSEHVYLGGLYLHKHEPYQTRNDFIPLQALHDLRPLALSAGAEIQIWRDITNIDQSFFAPYVNAWDCELTIVVEESLLGR
jgi:hypothetical protein